MHVGRPLAEGDRVDAIAAGQVSHKGTAALEHPSETGGLPGVEIGRPSNVADRVQQKPAEQGTGQRMVAQQLGAEAADQQPDTRAEAADALREEKLLER